MAPPILQCSSGHVFCTSCLSRLEAKLCPICRVAIDDQPARNLSLEQLLTQCGAKSKCPTCDELINYDDFVAHVQACGFTCPIGDTIQRRLPSITEEPTTIYWYYQYNDDFGDLQTSLGGDLIDMKCSCIGKRFSSSQWYEHMEQHRVLRADGRAYTMFGKELVHFQTGIGKSSCTLSGSHDQHSLNWTAMNTYHSSVQYRGFRFPSEGSYEPSQEYGQHNGSLIILKNERVDTDGVGVESMIPHDLPPLLIRCYKRYEINQSTQMSNIAFEFTAKLMCSNAQRSFIATLSYPNVPYLIVTLQLRTDTYDAHEMKETQTIGVSNCDGQQPFRLHSYFMHENFELTSLRFAFGFKSQTDDGS